MEDLFWLAVMCVSLYFAFPAIAAAIVIAVLLSGLLVSGVVLFTLFAGKFLFFLLDKIANLIVYIWIALLPPTEEETELERRKNQVRELVEPYLNK